MDNQSKKINIRLSNIFYRIILIFAIAILSFLSVSSFLIHGHLDSDGQEYMLLIRNGIVFYILLVALLTVLILISKVLDKITPLKLFIALSLVYIAVGTFIIATVPGDIRADAYMIYKHAVKFMAHDYEGLTDGFYMRYFPYQLGMLTYEMGLLSIWNNTKIFFIGNLIFTIAVMFVTWKTTELLYGEKTAKYAILLSFGFLPILYFIVFVYGWVPGLFFVDLGGYFLARHFKKKGKLNWLFCAISLGIAYIFKPNCIIAVVAVGIIIFIEAVRKADIKRFATCILIVIIPIIINASFLQTWRWITGINFDGGHPYSLNIVMGLMPEEQGTGRRGGWYNGYNMDTFRESGFDQEKTKEMASEKMAELMEYWSEDPSRTVSFFAVKIWTTWCDPHFQSLWCGPMEALGYKVDNRITHSLFNGGWLAIFSERYMSALVDMIYILACMYCIISFKNLRFRKEGILPILMLIGGFLFHLASEITSQYVFIYVFSIIPCAASALCTVIDTRRNQSGTKSEK